MPIFFNNKGQLQLIKSTEIRLEKDLQKLIENNLQIIFNCRFIASEFSTGNVHAGRIDTLALSEENNPVIIEYKKVASSDLINQSLYYLHWIKDHKGDFQMAVNKVLGNNIQVDWSEVRVICIAPEYKKYDLHAVQVMGANIELWQYKLYENNLVNLEEVFRRNESLPEINDKGKNPVMVEAGKKAAITRNTATYYIEDHKKKLRPELQSVFEIIRDYIAGLGEAIEETLKQNYIGYKTSQNFVCLEAQRNKMYLFLKINADELQPLPAQCRDVRNIGHFGTGDLEVTIRSVEDFEQTKHLINKSLQNIGG